MDRTEEFQRLTQVVRQLISDGRNRLQENTYKKIANVLQITEMPVHYKTLSIFKKEDDIDVLKKSKPIKFLGYNEILPDGTVTFIANANQLALGLEKCNRLNRLNTGENYGSIHCKTISNLIKNNPDLNIDELIETLKKKC